MAVSPEQVNLRLLQELDLELVLAWRNDQEVMRFLPTATRPLLWQDHHRWFGGGGGLVEQPHWAVTYDDRSTRPRTVGVTHCHLATGEVGILLGEKSLWGQGIGRAALELTLRAVTTPYWQVHRDQFGPIWAVIHPENVASRQLFESLNFLAIGQGRNGQIKYLWQGWKE